MKLTHQDKARECEKMTMASPAIKDSNGGRWATHKGIRPFYDRKQCDRTVGFWGGGALPWEPRELSSLIPPKAFCCSLSSSFPSHGVLQLRLVEDNCSDTWNHSSGAKSSVSYFLGRGERYSDPWNSSYHFLIPISMSYESAVQWITLWEVLFIFTQKLKH